MVFAETRLPPIKAKARALLAVWVLTPASAHRKPAWVKITWSGFRVNSRARKRHSTSQVTARVTHRLLFTSTMTAVLCVEQNSALSPSRLYLACRVHPPPPLHIVIDLSQAVTNTRELRSRTAVSLPRLRTSSRRGYRFFGPDGAGDQYRYLPPEHFHHSTRDSWSNTASSSAALRSPWHWPGPGPSHPCGLETLSRPLFTGINSRRHMMFWKMREPQFRRTKHHHCAGTVCHKLLPPPLEVSARGRREIIWDVSTSLPARIRETDRRRGARPPADKLCACGW